MLSMLLSRIILKTYFKTRRLRKYEYKNKKLWRFNGYIAERENPEMFLEVTAASKNIIWIQSRRQNPISIKDALIATKEFIEEYVFHEYPGYQSFILISSAISRSSKFYSFSRSGEYVLYDSHIQLRDQDLDDIYNSVLGLTNKCNTLPGID